MCVRRLRACILGVIPGDVIDAAVDACQKTLAGGNKEPLIDRVRKGAKIFEEKFSITIPMLEKYIGCKLEAFSENDLIRLNNVYRSLNDGMAKREDYFDLGTVEQDDSELTDPFAKKESEETEPVAEDVKEKKKPGRPPKNDGQTEMKMD